LDREENLREVRRQDRISVLMGVGKDNPEPVVVVTSATATAETNRVFTP
jgi:hypothetical protein